MRMTGWPYCLLIVEPQRFDLVQFSIFNKDVMANKKLHYLIDQVQTR